MTATETACVSPGNQGWGGLSLQLLSLQVPSGSDNGSAGERSPGLLPSRPRWPPSHPPGRCSRSPMFAVSQHPPPVDVTWGRPDRQRSAVDAECLSPQSLDALKSWGLSRTWVEGGPREANWLMGEGDSAAEVVQEGRRRTVVWGSAQKTPEIIWMTPPKTDSCFSLLPLCSLVSPFMCTWCSSNPEYSTGPRGRRQASLCFLLTTFRTEQQPALA